MGWTIQYTDVSAREMTSHVIEDKDAAVRYAHDLERHPNYATVTKIVHADGRKITKPELTELWKRLL